MASYVPMILPVHIYLGACSEPVSLDSACNTIGYFITANFTLPR